MRAYRVEEMENDTVRSTHLLEAPTPFEAASKAIGRAVTLRRSEADWVRVTDLTYDPRRNGRRTTVFEYRGIGSASPKGR